MNAPHSPEIKLVLLFIYHHNYHVRKGIYSLNKDIVAFKTGDF